MIIFVEIPLFFESIPEVRDEDSLRSLFRHCRINAIIFGGSSRKIHRGHLEPNRGTCSKSMA